MSASRLVAILGDLRSRGVGPAVVDRQWTASMITTRIAGGQAFAQSRRHEPFGLLIVSEVAPPSLSDRPAVSVCIPTYCRPEALRCAIASVLRQSISDLEVVVSDDSTQGVSVVNALADERVRYRANSPRLGMAGNWQAALDATSAPAVALLMDDDVLLPGFLQRSLEVLANEPEVGVAFSNHYFVEGDRRWLRECELPAGTHHDFVVPLLKHEK